MRTEYARALEQQMRWNTFHRAHGATLWKYIALEHDGKHGAVQIDDTGQITQDKYEITAGGKASLLAAGLFSGLILGKGDTFFISTDIQRLVMNAAKTLPDATFQRTMLPSPYGFMVFGEPLEMGRVKGGPDTLPPTPDDFPIFASAMGWAYDADLIAAYKRENRDAPRGAGVEFVFYTQAEMYGTKGYWPVAYFGIDEGGSWQAKLDAFERDVLVPQGEARSNSVAHEIAFVFALLLFMEQRVIVSRPERLDRATRRRSEREQLPREHIKVITLRRYAERAPTADEEQHVEWSCQWAVRGHWRQQPYRSTGEIKPLWINPYTKGPEGKPFRDDDARRLFSVTR